MPDKIDKSGMAEAALGALDRLGPFERLAVAGEYFQRILGAGPNPFATEVERLISPTLGVVNGRETLLFGTNNYLGLNAAPEYRAAAHAALDRFGLGATASRVACGTQSCHRLLEGELAALFGRRHATIFSTGYQASVGVVAGLAVSGSVLFLDKDCHASIYDGAAVSGARVATFAHNDAADLDRKMAESGVAPGKGLILVEGLYSVAGDCAPLADFAEVKRRRRGVLLVDEAHSFGAYGERGLGVAEAQGVAAEVDVVFATFSKSLGAIGGFATSDRDGFDMLRFFARSYLFTAALPPVIVEAVRAGVARVAGAGELRARLWRNARRLHAGLAKAGFALACPQAGPIVGIRCKNLFAGYALWRAVLERGVSVNFMTPPATPNHEVILRCSVSALHEESEIDRAVEIFAASA